MAPTVGVVLSGCGFQDGAEIQEMDLMGNRLAVRWLQPNDTRAHIWIIDLESGVVLRKLTQP